MGNKLFLTLLTIIILILFNYAYAQIITSSHAEEIFPILKWIVNKTPHNWYVYLIDLVNSYSVVMNLKIEQEVRNGDELNLKFRAPSYVDPSNTRLVLREGFTKQFIKVVTSDEINNGNVKFIVPVLNVATSKQLVYFAIYTESSSLDLERPEKIGEALIVTPPLRYIYTPPQPKITIIPQIRTQEIREIRPNTTTEIQYVFKVENTPTRTPFYLDSLTFEVNQQYKWPFKEVNITIHYPDNVNKVEITSTSTKYSRLTISLDKLTTPPLINGEYKVTLFGVPYSPQDKDYPYTNGYASFSFISVTAKDKDGKVKIESKGRDTSHTYKIIVPYYPNVTINAKVGSEEYPAIVYEKKGDIAILYFTSFTGNFNAIRAGIQLPATTTFPTRGVTSSGIMRSIEVSYGCGGTCPRTYEELVAKFGSPDKWAIPLIRWDWSKTAQYTLNMNMNCSGVIPTIVNDDPKRNRSFVFVCSNRKAFGNNFGWDRQLTLRLNWAMMTGNEKLNYEVFYPEAVKLTVRNILPKTLSALIFKLER